MERVGLEPTTTRLVGEVTLISLPGNKMEPIAGVAPACPVYKTGTSLATSDRHGCRAG